MLIGFTLHALLSEDHVIELLLAVESSSLAPLGRYSILLLFLIIIIH